MPNVLYGRTVPLIINLFFLCCGQNPCSYVIIHVCIWLIISSGDLSDDIINLGFTFTDKLTLLGFQLQNYGDIAASNFEKIGIKIDNLIRFWERFFLSLPGKLTVYKTFLISQINYVAAAFNP